MEGFKLELAMSVKLLGLTIDQNWTLYDKDISNICKAVSAKFKSLSRIRNALEKKTGKITVYFFWISLSLITSLYYWCFTVKKSYK